jgi:hypothetical protein
MTCFHEIAAVRKADFTARGLKESLFFPHRFYCLPKGGPDALLLANRLCGRTEPAELWEIVLYANPPTLAGIPTSLFFDDELIWHQQQFGLPGQVATASLVLRGPTVYALTYQSDLVQRISRHREHKTRIENRLKGWVHMLLNAVVCFAIERGGEVLHSLKAETSWRNTDPRRRPQRELFDRVYDRSLLKRFSATPEGPWWRLGLAENRARAVWPETRRSPPSAGRVLGLCHDVERALGHKHRHTTEAASMDAIARAALPDMLAVERQLGIRATYNLLGLIFSELREPIERDGHATAFHSFDHRVDTKRLLPGWKALRRLVGAWRTPALPFDDQLSRCRSLDYRIKGYRPPQSRIGAGLSDRNLSFYNFEWLASSSASLGCQSPRLDNGIVKIPIHFDDFALHQGRLSFAEWKAGAIRKIEEHAFAGFSLHDCYADHWLPHYRGFLETVGAMGEFRTLNQVSSDVILASAR